MRSALAILVVAAITVSTPCLNAEDPSVSNYVDRILGRKVADPKVSDQNSDKSIDVRDLAVYIDGQATDSNYATFDTRQTRVFSSQSSVKIPISFSKPLTGSIRIELGGSAVGSRDYKAFGSPVQGFRGLVTQINLKSASKATLTIPLIHRANEILGERRLVLTIRSLATLKEGDQVTRTASAAPGRISTHTVIIADADRIWTGYMDFPARSGFGKQPVVFALNKNGKLTMAMRDSKFFAKSTPSTGSVSASDVLTFTSPITGTYQPTSGAPNTSWTMTISDAAKRSTTAAPQVHSAKLTISNFPSAGIKRSYTFPVSLFPSN